MTITDQQMKTARALLGWSQFDLADAAGVSFWVVSNFEGGIKAPFPVTLAAIQRTLEQAGIEFGPGSARLAD